MKAIFRGLCLVCFLAVLFFGCGDIENARVWHGLLTSMAGMWIFGLLGGVVGHDLDSESC